MFPRHVPRAGVIVLGAGRAGVQSPRAHGRVPQKRADLRLLTELVGGVPKGKQCTDGGGS
jgi:hypothetical protein